MTKPSVEARTVEEIAEQIAGDAPLNDIYATRRLKAEILCALQSAEARALREAADVLDGEDSSMNDEHYAKWLRARATEKESTR